MPGSASALMLIGYELVRRRTCGGRASVIWGVVIVAVDGVGQQRAGGVRDGGGGATSWSAGAEGADSALTRSLEEALWVR